MYQQLTDFTVVVLDCRCYCEQCDADFADGFPRVRLETTILFITPCDFDEGEG